MVFNDADVSSAVNMLVKAKFRNAGQICIAPTRFIVQDRVHDKFVEQFVTATGQLRVGSGLDPDVDMGPLSNDRRPNAIEALVEDAVRIGATVASGGHAIEGPGYLWEPTVLTNVDPSSRIMIEEPFGPVAPVVAFHDVSEGIELANSVAFGLAPYAFTASLSTARMLSESVETGMLGINDIMVMGPETPFGGVKDSGYGSESGTEGIESFMHSKYIREG